LVSNVSKNAKTRKWICLMALERFFFMSLSGLYRARRDEGMNLLWERVKAIVTMVVSKYHLGS